MADTLSPTPDEVPVAGPPASVARGLQSDLTPRLSFEDEQALAHQSLTEYHACLADRSEWESRLAEWDRAYFNEVVDKTFPWPGACNFHVPLTMTYVETMKPRLVDGVLGQTPPILIVPVRASDEERKDTVEAFLNWQILTELNIEPLVAQSAHLFLHPGLAVAKTTWRVTRTHRKQIRDFPAGTEIPTIFEDLFEGTVPEDLTQDPDGDLRWSGTLPTAARHGAPLTASVTFRFGDDGAIQVRLDQETLTEGPVIALVDPTDLIVPVKGGQEIADLPYVKQRLWMTAEDLRQRAASGQFYVDVVEDLLRGAPPSGDQPTLDAHAYRQGQDRAEGVDGSGQSNVRRTQWEILEDYRTHDIDGDGVGEQVIVWLSPDAPGRLLGYDYLDNVYAHGRRPLRVAGYLDIPLRFYRLPVAEVIKGIQDEINAIHQQRVDYGTIQNMPFGFKKASSTMPPIDQRLKPGAFIDVDNPQTDINIPKWQGSTTWGQSEEATLMQSGERLLGISDINLGRQPNRVGATRTAKGTQTLLGESGLRFKLALASFQRFWAGIFSDVLALDQAYLPAGAEFRVTGKSPTVMRLEDRTALRGRYDLRIASSSEGINRGQMREDATVVMQALLNPAAIQAGIVGMKGIRRAYADMLKAFGKDPDFYLEDVRPIRSPTEELMSFVSDQYLDPTAGEHYDWHLDAHQAALQDASLPAHVRHHLERHIQATHEVQRAQQMSQTLQGGMPGMVPMGAQAPQALQGAAQPQGLPGGQTNGTAGLPLGGPGGG